MSTFGSELRRYRQRAGLSQEGLAARAGLSPEAVSLLERGRRTPRMTTLSLLAAAVVALMLAATAAVVVLSARAGLDAHRQTIDVMHGLGARELGHMGFADVAASVAAHLGVPSQGPGRSVL